MTKGKSMKAVVFNGVFDVSLEDRLVPEIQNPTDAIVKVKYTALCGSELHVYRGHQPSPTGFIMGHEFTGVVESVGSSIQNFKAGDKVVCPFTISCGVCFYCKHGATSRCEHSRLFGSKLLDGAQAEYVRVPLADTTMFKQPSQDEVAKYGITNYDEKKFVMMADIFPTGYFAAKNALKNFNWNEYDEEKDGPIVFAVVGCGPVALCAIIALFTMIPKDRKCLVYAIDFVEDRLKEAEKLGAIPIDASKPENDAVSIIKRATNGRGADAALEIVGLSPALKLAFDIIRPWGTISSVGVHNDVIPFNGNDAYNKNVSLQFGRCPVRSIFEESLKVMVQNFDKLDVLTGHVMKLADAKEGYDLFHNKKVQKVIFEC